MAALWTIGREISMKVLIIGGVAGGMSAATRLRRLKEDAEIIVFEQGPHVSYANCGLPYHVGDVIPEQESLLLQTPQSLWNRFRLDVRVNNRVLKINREIKSVEVQNLQTNETYSESYDKLIISTGAKPRSSGIPGSERAHVLRDVQDAAKIKQQIDAGNVKSAVIIGAGFIGVELAENLIHRGVQTAIIQVRETILPQFDLEMIEPLQKTLTDKGISLHLNSKVAEIGANSVTLTSGRVLPADLVVSAIGVVPDHHLAVQAGLRIGETGGIWVSENLQTSDEDIFAVGDAAEKTNAITGNSQMIWLANLANRHGRLVADVIAGEISKSRKSIGTGIIGAFGMVAAITGINETQARKSGLSHQVIHLHPGSHAGYYPGAERISIKVIFEPDSGRLLGAQATGRDGADKRIDVLATAIYAGLTINDLMELELAYAPAFGSAKDAINQAGYVGNNIYEGKTKSVQWHEIEAEMSKGATIVDVRNPEENAAGAIPGALLIPVDTLRENLEALPNKNLIVYCAVGQRGHTAVQILKGHGIPARNLDGGYNTWRLAMDAMQRVR